MKTLVALLVALSLFLIIGCTQPVVQEVPAPGFEDVPEMIVVQDDGPTEATAEEEPEEVTPEPPRPVPRPVVREFVIEGDDRGLYPNSIEVNEGETVLITFKVRGEGTYFGGLDFRSDLWGDTGKVPPGEETEVTFLAKESMPFESYWPASNTLKATGEIIVK